MLTKHHEAWDGTLGKIPATRHRIDTVPGSRPIFQRPYRSGLRNCDAIAEHVKQKLDAGVIEPASREWASPVILAPNKDGTLRFCVDFRRLNEKTNPDSYPLPRMDDCLDSIGDAQIFTTLDCNSGYWQIPIAGEDRDKSSFTTHRGTYRYKRMHFGLRNAPETFQRALAIVLSGVRFQSCLIYLDDVIVFSDSEKYHIVEV